MRITIPTIGTGTQGDSYRPDLPEGIRGSAAEYGPDYQTVTVTLPDTPEHERWAVENGHHTPAQVRTGHLLIELLENWPEVYSSLQAALESNPAAKIAIQHEAHVSRDGQLTSQMQEALELTDETVDEIFRAAYLRRL